MKTYIVTRAFQWKGSMWRTGQQLKLTDAEAKDPFVKPRVRLSKEGEAGKSAPAPHLGNGEPKERGKTPSEIAEGVADGADEKEMRAALLKAGVPVPPNAGKAELAKLWESFKEATAGSPAEASRPKQG